MYKALFFAGLEQGLSREEVDSYRDKYGIEFKKLGFDVKDPTLGKDIKSIPRDRLLREDAELQEQSHITVAYLPTSSEGTLREVKRARELKQLAFGFTDKGNNVPEGFEDLLDAWYSDFAGLKDVLSTYLFPIGEYFTTANTNNIQGDLVLYGQDIHQVAPHYLHSLLNKLQRRRNIFYFCCERSHVHELAQKLPTIMRLSKLGNIYILTKDGSPHDIQMHTLVEEVRENQGYDGNVEHYVVERGKLCEISRESVKISRHLSNIENLTKGAKNEESEDSPLVAIITGSKSDEPRIQEAKIFELLESFGIKYDFQVISSDRTPEKLRRYCIDNCERLDAVIAIAGGVPNLPITVKGWLPNTPVVSVPLDENTDFALASLTTPKDRPIMVAGYGLQGLKKAVFLVKDFL